VGVAGLSVFLGPAPLLAAPAAAADAPVAVSIPVGTSPLAIAADASTDMVYVANSGSYATSPGTVSVIDGHESIGGQPNLGHVVTTIDVGRYPVGVAVDPATDLVYVANGGSSSVSVIDGMTNKVTATIALGTEPEGIGVVPSTDMIYVAQPDGQSAGAVAVINGRTNTVVGSIGVGQGPWGVGVNTVSGTVYVGNQGGDGPSTSYAGTVSVIRGTSVVATVTVDEAPFGIGVDQLTGMAYVATVDEVDGALGEPSEVVVIDHANSIVAKIRVNNPIGVAVDAADDTVFVGLKYSGYANGPIGSLAVIDGRSNSVTNTYSLGGNPWGVAVDPTTDRVYVASDTKPGLVYMVAGKAPPTPPEPPPGPVGSIVGIRGSGSVSVSAYNPKGVAAFYRATVGTPIFQGDLIATDPNAKAVVEFVIGGRVGINTNSTVVVAGERSVADAGPHKPIVVTLLMGVWGIATMTAPEPLEIQTNGGVMGGLKG
jgi:YVTN family beta-propeller protein